jgi:glycosyltransferase involved in cell wall biosynthesis
VTDPKVNATIHANPAAIGKHFRKNMKIAQIAPLMESVPPRLYGGTERVVSYLTDELVQMGHDVTLFASGDSVSSANLVRCVPTALRLDPNVSDPIPYYMLMLDRVREFADEFDILHFHIDQFHFPLFRPIAHRTVTTLHGRQDLHDLKPLYVGFSDLPLVAISDAQREPIAKANIVATVHHGIPVHLRRAIRLARALDIPIKIAAKIDKVDEAYFRATIATLFNQPGVEYVGEIDERAKSAFLGGASALLFPVDCPEPFGLSMIEAIACGTPVLAFHCGSVPEIIDPAVTGHIVRTMDEAIRMLPQVLALDRRTVRQRFEQRFSATRMAKDYVQIYRSLLKQPPLMERAAVMSRLEPDLEKGMN